MSLVLGYATKDYAIIMSDGRAGGTARPSEEYNKTLKFNENVILGYVGYAESCEYIIEYIYSQLNPDKSDITIDDLWDILDFVFEDEQAKVHVQATFMIIGKHSDGNMYTSIIGRVTDYKLEFNKVILPRYLSIGGTIDGNIINTIYTQNMNMLDIPVKKRLLKTIVEISAIDSSINSTTFCITIYL